ncbi:MAG: 30S ribosomal protein S12 methylthiotransferase RimO [candidate division FCPU426 bacterium]
MRIPLAINNPWAPKVCLITLGCPKNQVDSEHAIAALTASGYRVVAEPDEAEVLVLNTCAFIRPAEEEAVQALLEAAAWKRKQRGRRLLAVGCLVAKYGAGRLQKLVPQVDQALPPHAVDSWVEAAQRLAPSSGRFGGPVHRGVSGPGTAYVKIAEGCSRRCTFCIIPRLRGPLCSVPMNEVLTEARALAARGAKEIVLVAQDLARYGYDVSRRPLLPALIDRLVKIPGLKWLRLMYVNPDGVDEALVRRLAREPKVCKYLDMPVQHAHPRVLRAMGRPGGAEKFLGLVRTLRQRVPGIVLRTTLLTGFPGETEAEHRALLDFVRAAEFDRVGVFTYSAEAGTPSAALRPRVPQATRDRRRRELMLAQAEISRRRLARRVGTVVDCLLEEAAGPRLWLGRTAGDAPEVDGGIVLTGAGRAGTIVRARVTGAGEHDLTGVIL